MAFPGVCCQKDGHFPQRTTVLPHLRCFRIVAAFLCLFRGTNGARVRVAFHEVCRGKDMCFPQNGQSAPPHPTFMCKGEYLPPLLWRHEIQVARADADADRRAQLAHVQHVADGVPGRIAGRHRPWHAKFRGDVGGRQDGGNLRLPGPGQLPFHTP